jgi:hypothetical protein
MDGASVKGVWRTYDQNDYLIKILGKKEKRVALVVVKELPLQCCGPP